MEKYNNKYRIQSARLQSWDYAWAGVYFITICTRSREHYLGEIENGKMQLSEIGKLSKKYWIEIPEHFPFIKLHAFVIMPNHIHGIIEIIKTKNARNTNNQHNNNNKSNNFDKRNVETRLIASLPSPPLSSSSPPSPPSSSISAFRTVGITGNKNPMFHENISRIIRWYKGRCSFEIRKTNPNFAWQSRFYDHIIRDENSYNRISQYIINNPNNWEKDKFYKRVK